MMCGGRGMWGGGACVGEEHVWGRGMCGGGACVGEGACAWVCVIVCT